MISQNGCKPRDRTLEGQVFIVTRASENMKLGLVEVLIIDEKAVTEFAARKQAEFEKAKARFEAELAEFEKGKARLATNVFLAQGELTVAQKDLDNFKTTLLTNPKYLKMKELENTLTAEIRTVGFQVQPFLSS